MSTYISVFARLAGPRLQVLAIDRMVRGAEADANVPAEIFECNIERQTGQNVEMTLRMALSRHHPTLYHALSLDNPTFAYFAATVGMLRSLTFECDTVECVAIIRGEIVAEDNAEERNAESCCGEGAIVSPSPAEIAFREYCVTLGFTN